MIDSIPIRFYVQIISLSISLFTLILIIVFYKSFSLSIRYCLIAPAIWLFHSSIFYSIVLVNNWINGFIPTQFFTNWSAWLRLNALVTIMGIVILHYRYREDNTISRSKEDLLKWAK